LRYRRVVSVDGARVAERLDESGGLDRERGVVGI